jgi:tetratricopeptide (TPR) repeat protein
MKLMEKNKNNEAIKYLRAAADKGEVEAFYPLGKLYFAKKEYKQAYRMLSQADASADSMYKLGYLKEHGKGTSRSYYSAYDFYKKSAKLGKKSAKNDAYRMAKAKKRLKSKARKKEQYQAVANKEQVQHNRERQRLASLEDQRIRQQRADKTKEANRLKIQACGNEPMDSVLRKSGTRVHLQGKVVHWLGKSAFVVKVHGEEYYIKDSDDEARVNKGDYVNIVAKATGKREIVRGLNRSIFDEADESAIAKAYALNFTGVCPY